MSMGTNTTAPTRDAGDEISNFFGNPSNYSGLLNYQTAAGNTYNSNTSTARQSTLGDMSSMLGGYASAISGSNPLLSSAQGTLTGMVNSAGTQSDLAKELSSQALADLKLGGTLSDEQNRDVTQATRAGLASRGMATGNNALGAELLSRANYADGLKQQRQTAALNVENLNNTELTGARNFVLGANSAGQGLSNSALTSLIGTNASASNANTAGLLGYLGDASSSNFNAQVDANRTNANNNAALWGTAIGTAGRLATLGFM